MAHERTEPARPNIYYGALADAHRIEAIFDEKCGRGAFGFRASIKTINLWAGRLRVARIATANAWHGNTQADRPINV